MKTIITLLFLGIETFCFAQNQTSTGEVLGKINESANTPLAFANMLLLNAKDSTLVKGSISKDSGEFIFENTKFGQYIIAASMVGYIKIYTQPFVVSAEKPKVKLATMVIKQNTNELKELAVTAKKPLFEQQIDRMVVNVASSITAAGGTALEVLERSPGVTVNKQLNSLMMSGKSGVMVMLNGKLTRLPMDAVIQMLDGMSANNIEKIELITAPSAQYDAEGDAGLINIVMKKNLNFGTNGSLSATFGYGWYFRPAATLALNHRNKKVNVYGDYSYNNNHTWSEWNFHRIVSQTSGPITIDIFSNRYSTFPQHNAKVGFDYSLSERTTINGLLSGFDTNSDLNAPNVSMEYQSNLPLKVSHLNTQEKNHWQHLMLNLSFRHVFKNKLEWSVDADKLWYNNSNPSAYFDDSQDVRTGIRTQQQFRVSKETPIQVWVMKTDFLSKLGKKGKLEAGLKVSLTDLDNDVRLERLQQKDWQIDPIFTQKYLLREDVLAGYTNYSTSLNAKTSLQTGLRYEYTKTDLETPEGKSLVYRQYGNFFPSMFLSHKFTKIHAVNGSYSRRITRPSYRDVAPFVIYFDQNTLASGNPALLPTISDAVQGSYVLNDTYIFSLKYSKDQNTISRYQPHLDAATNQLYYYAENMAEVQTLSLSMSIPVKFTRWWQSQNNLTGYWQQMKTTYEGLPLNHQIWNGQVNTSHTFLLPRKFTAELTYFQNSPTLSGIARSLAKSELTVGIQKQLPKEKGTLRLNISDIFWRNISRWQVNVPAINAVETGYLMNEPRVVRITYSRNFGNKNVKANKKRATGSEEERLRL